MRQSELFSKTRRDAPSDEVAKNAQLLIRAGFINKEMSGVYSLLPLGIKVVNNIKKIVAEEMENIGSKEILMSTLQNKETWEKTGRWSDQSVDVWFKSKLKNDSEIGFGWSHEEPISEMMKSYISSYKDLPIYVHQFQNKLRNEARAKSGIMRCREFIMKDMYCFTSNEEDNLNFYQKSIDAYKNVFDKIGIGSLTFVTSASGGLFTDKFSHEFQTICDAGEDIIYIDEKNNIAVNNELYNEENLSKLDLKGSEFVEKKSAEVGNIFNFGAKKSEEMGLYFVDKNGEKKPAFMSSYGIGITRLMGVLVEIFSKGDNMFWPENISPFKFHIIEVSSENTEVRNLAEKIYKMLGSEKCLYDDRSLRVGEKFKDADLIGIPNQIIVGEKNISSSKFEFKNRIKNTCNIIDWAELIKSI